MRRAGEAVQIELAGGLGFDVVPCFSLKPDYSWEEPFYVIPDGANGWMRTNPRKDQDWSEQLHRDNNKTLRKAVKLVKYWNSQNLDGRLQSYFIELAIMKAFAHQNRSGRIIQEISEGTALAFGAVRDASIHRSQPAILAGAPPVERGDISQEDWNLLDAAARTAQHAWNLERQGQIQNAIKTWRLVFGDEFAPE